MKKKKNDIHIGECIKARAKELRIGPTELGLLVKTSKQNVYGIFKRSSMDTGQLRLFCEALSFDFFLLLSQPVEMSEALTKIKDGNLYPKELKKLRAELSKLEKEMAFLRQSIGEKAETKPDLEG